MISHSTEIVAPASVVREVLMDFEHLSEWHTEFLKSIKITTPGRKDGRDLIPGDKIHSRIATMSFNQTVQINTPTEFQWIGPWYGLLTGIHGWQFLPSLEHPESPSHCRVVQNESFTGILSFMMDSPTSYGGKQTLAAFEIVERDLKARAESVWAERK